jgi:serine/threonine protein kinase/WD40 repeat protein/formylglycine-generating enzyme required for sulfatase activity
MAQTPLPRADGSAESVAADPAGSVRTEVSTPGDQTMATIPGAAGSRSFPTMLVDPAVGTTIGFYRLEKKLGEGGMGAVWKALHVKLDKHVALKLLPAQLTRDARLVARFEREMKAVGKVDHPNVVRAMDAGEFQGLHYLVMEYIDGTDLSEFVKSRGPQPVRQACELLRQATLGLAAAHKLGLVHRDIKPSNLFLTKPRDGGSGSMVKILDLGLARLQDDTPATDRRANLTGTGTMMGTPDYMAPEQWGDTHSVDGRADLYALGCTLFYLLTGRAPYGDEAHSHIWKKMAAHSSEPIPDLCAVRQAARTQRKTLDDVPDAVASLYRRLMAKRPEERVQTADELATMLLSIVKALGSGGTGLRDLQINPPSRIATAERPAVPVQIVPPGAHDADTSQTLKDSAVESIFATRIEAALPATAPEPLGPADRKTPSAPKKSEKPPRAGGPSKVWIAGGALAAVVLLAGIIIKIRNKDGSVTEIKAPEGTQRVDIEQDGKTIGRFPAETTKPNPGEPEPQQAMPGKMDGEAPGSPDFAAQHKAAEQLLASNVADLVFVSPDGRFLGNAGPQWQGGTLPQEPFLIRSINFAPDATDETIALLKGCNRLHVLLLNFNSCGKVTDKGLLSLPPCPLLANLDLSFTQFTDDSMGILDRCPSLRALSLVGAAVTDAGMERLRGVPNLTYIHLPLSVGDPGLVSVARHCRKLRKLQFGYPHDRITSLEPLTELKSLRHVFCRDAHLTNAGVEILAKLVSLESLQIEQPDKDTLVRLQPLRSQLRELSMRVTDDRTRLPDGDAWAALESFSALQSLQFLDLIGIDRSGMNRLAAMEGLKSLDIAGTPWLRDEQADLIREFRRRRPDVALTVADVKEKDKRIALPSLASWPEADDGGIAAWNLPKEAPAPAVVPFAADQAKKHQEAWADFLKQPVEVENSIGMKFRLIPPSEFTITEGEQRHLVRVPQSFYLGTTEVTWDQFRRFAEASGYKTDAERLGIGWNRESQSDPKMSWRTPWFATKPDQPATILTMNDVRAFCAWLSANERVTYRPPMEYEWEAATRAGGDGPYGWCATIEQLGEVGWFAQTTPDAESPLQPVGRKAPNPFGLFDVFGSLWEYCDGSRHAPGANSVSATPAQHVVRGLSWESSWTKSLFMSYQGDNYYAHTGFRVLRELPGAAAPPKPLDQPSLARRGDPLSPWAVVGRPAAIPGLRSWSVELASHNGNPLAALAWSPRGDLIATAYGEDGSIRLWDSQGRLQRVLLGASGSVRSLSFSQDGALLASSEQHTAEMAPGMVRVWDVASGRSHVIAMLSDWIDSAVFSPARREVAVNDRKSGLLLVDLESGRSRFLSGLPVQSMAWSPDGKSLVTGNQRGQVCVWRPGAAAKPDVVEVPDWKNGPGMIDAVAWSPDGKWIAARSGGDVRVWDAQTRAHRQTTSTKFESLRSLAWSRDSHRMLLATGQDPAWVVIDALAGKLLLESRSGSSYGAAWNPEETEIVDWVHSGIAFVGQGPLLFFDANTGDVLRQGLYRGKAVGGWLQSISPEGGEVVAIRHDGHVLVFDSETGMPTRSFPTPDAKPDAVGWSPSGRHFALFGNQNLRLVDANTGELVQTWKMEKQAAEPRPVTRASWSPDGLSLATCSGEPIVRIWSISQETPAQEVRAPAGSFVDVAWSPDGSRLATIGDDRSVRTWDPLNGQLVRTYEGLPQPQGGSIAWSRSSRELWIPLTGDVVWLDLATGRFSSSGRLSHIGAPVALDTSAGGDTLIADSYQWTIFRDGETGVHRLLQQHLGVPHWLPDGRRFLGYRHQINGLAASGFDTRRERRLGTLFPMVCGEPGFDQWLCVGPTGHYRGSEKIDEHIVYVAMHDDGSQVTYTPAEFRDKFDWKNDPEKATLMKLSE